MTETCRILLSLLGAAIASQRLRIMLFLLPSVIAFGQPNDSALNKKITIINPENVVVKSKQPVPQIDEDKIRNWLTKDFFNAYQDIFKSTLTHAAQVKFRNNFRYAVAQNFDVLVIISPEQTLLQFVPTTLIPKIKIYQTNVNPQIKFQEIHQEQEFSDGKTIIVSAAVQSSIFEVQGTLEVSGDGALDGPIIPYKLKNSAIVSITGRQRWLFTETKEGVNTDVFEHQTTLEGHTVLLGSILSKRSTERLAAEIFNFDLKSLCFSSKPFRRALGHPLLKDGAEAIFEKARYAQEREYPLWAFLDDLSSLKQLSKDLGFDDTYVDQLLNKEQIIEKLRTQYDPMGTLIINYRTRAGFMMQWALINSLILFVSIFIVVFFPNIGSDTIVGIVVFFGIVNGWIISQKPENFIWSYWLLPLAIFVLSLIVLFRQNLLDLLAGKPFYSK